jgi:hypothetical protein
MAGAVPVTVMVIVFPVLPAQAGPRRMPAPAVRAYWQAAASPPGRVPP